MIDAGPTRDAVVPIFTRRVFCAGGLILYFVCAIFAHLRVGWYSTIPFPAVFLAVAFAALALRLADR